MIAELGLQYRNDFKEFDLFPSLIDRSRWEVKDVEFTQSIIEEADQYLGYEYPRLTASMYLRFSEDGNRTEYQKAYYERRYVLNVLVKAECISNEGRYMTDIINGIYTICEESAWNIPAHNTYVRDTRGPILPDYERPVLALFSCETGSNMALIDYLLGDKLDAKSPVIRQRIACELERRIITPYLKEHFWWMGHEDEPMNNWTIWCTQSILVTFFLSSQSEDHRQQAFQKACKSTDYFLKEYEEDGCCDEGASYYRKAGLCLMNTLELLNSITEGQFSSVYETKKIYNMAEFIFNMQIEGKYYINFADCSAGLEPSGVREYLFGKRTQNSQLMAYAAKDYMSQGEKTEKEINLFYHIQEILLHDEVASYEPTEEIVHRDVFYESVGLGIVRDERFCLAVKAGDNADSHNHNDVGSYTLFVDDKPLIVDIGVETYSAKTFSSQRYDIWTMQSDYHNLPTINGCMQLPGESYKAMDVSFENDETRFRSSMDIAKAYPEVAMVEEYVRRIYFEKGQDITIVDEVRTKNLTQAECISNLILYEKPRIDGQCLVFDKGSTIMIEGMVDAIDVEVLQIEDERLKWAWDHELYRVRIHFSEKRLKLTIR